MRKYNWIFSIYTVSILILFFTAVISPRHIIAFLDLFFYTGIILLLLGGVLLIIQGGFFTRFLNNSRRFYSTISKREQVIQNVEGKGGETSSYSKKFPLLTYILPIGVFYFLVSLVGSIITVQFGR